MYGDADRLTADDVDRALAIEDGGHVPASRSSISLECPDPPPEGWFWEAVHGPFKERRLPPEVVRDLLARHLAETGGFYTRVADRLGVDRDDYQRFLDFLKHSGLKVDHRPYRPGQKSPGQKKGP